VQAINDVGIQELDQAITDHERFIRSSGKLEKRRQEQRREEFIRAVEQRLRKRLSRLMKGSNRLMALWGGVEAGQIDPYSALDMMEQEAISRGWLPEP